MKKLIIIIYKSMINLIYTILKTLIRQKDKVVFISRQKDVVNDDFAMLIDNLPSVEKEVICIRDHGTLSSKLRLAFLTIKSLALLASCKVCVLDSYWPGVSLLKHKNFTVIQIWHSIGKIKKSGYQTLGKASGRNEQTAKLLNMHGNYDYVIAGAKAWNKFYCESFNINEDCIRNYGLPRIDRIIKKKNINKDLFFKTYPELSNKKIVLYAPTFRRGYDFNFNDMVNKLSSNNYTLVVKLHPNSTLDNKENNYITCPDVKTDVVMSAADYIITDYSAIALEAAIIDVNTYYFIPDYEDYLKNNGLNVKIEDEVPELCFRNAKELVKKLENDEYNYEVLQHYKDKFLIKDLGNSTRKITTLIMDIINSDR